MLGALGLTSNCAHWIRRTTKCHCSVVYSKRDAKRAFKFSSDVARQYLTKEPDAPFHMTVKMAILLFQANSLRVELFTSYVNTHFLLFNESENAL